MTAVRDGSDGSRPGPTCWERFCERYWASPELGFWLDASRVRVDPDFFGQMAPAAGKALAALGALEAGAIANADESRMVGHYWLRAPELAPTPAIAAAIGDCVRAVHVFARAVRSGEIRGAGGPFRHVVHVGIGGSALGPQLLVGALSRPGAPIDVAFLDNADPDTIDVLLDHIGNELGQTLVSVVSKSGWTPTPLYVLRELEARYRVAGLQLSDHAVATTMDGSELDSVAVQESWLGRFPIWDWVGGRTSVTSAVGLLPAALAGVDIDDFLAGAAAMDEIGRRPTTRENPALLLSLLWHWLGGGRGDRHMVVLPYRDRLSLFSCYVQQLVMESVGKRLDRAGAVVRQGLTVFGNKGATDQHAYLQQIRDGRDDAFVLFVAVGGAGHELTEIEPGIRLSEYLFASLEATAGALYERGRDSITIGAPDGSARSLGALVALLERAVGLYAELLDVNAYHQPGVDKDVARDVVALHRAAVAHLECASAPLTALEIAAAMGRPDDAGTVFRVLCHLVGTSAGALAMSTDRGPATIRFSATRAKNGSPPTGEAAWTATR